MDEKLNSRCFWVETTQKGRSVHIHGADGLIPDGFIGPDINDTLIFESPPQTDFYMKELGRAPFFEGELVRDDKGLCMVELVSGIFVPVPVLNVIPVLYFDKNKQVFNPDLYIVSRCGLIQKAFDVTPAIWAIKPVETRRVHLPKSVNT